MYIDIYLNLCILYMYIWLDFIVPKQHLLCKNTFMVQYLKTHRKEKVNKIIKRSLHFFSCGKNIKLYITQCPF